MKEMFFLTCLRVGIFFLFWHFQVFDSNANSDKLFRFKLGKGKVIKVSSIEFFFNVNSSSPLTFKPEFKAKFIVIHKKYYVLSVYL